MRRGGGGAVVTGKGGGAPRGEQGFRQAVGRTGLQAAVIEPRAHARRRLEQFRPRRIENHADDQFPRKLKADRNTVHRAIVDVVRGPVDGTTNYVHDCPMYCISIGLQLAGELIVGVVLDPTRPELFKAATGMGAWLNDRRLQTSATDRLAEALLAPGGPPALPGHDRPPASPPHFPLHPLS